MPRITIDGIGEVDVAPEFMALPGDQQNAMIQQFAASRAARPTPAATPMTMRAPDFYRADDYHAAERQIRSIGDSVGAMSLAGLPQMTMPSPEQRDPQSGVFAASMGPAAIRPYALSPTHRLTLNDPLGQPETEIQQSSAGKASTAYGRGAIAQPASYARPYAEIDRASFDKIPRDVGQPLAAVNGVGGEVGTKGAEVTAGELPRGTFSPASASPGNLTVTPGAETLGTPKNPAPNNYGRHGAQKDLAYLVTPSTSYTFQNYVGANPKTYLTTPDNSMSVVATGPVTPTASGGYITTSTVHAYIGGHFESYTPTEEGGGAISVTPDYSNGVLVGFTITNYYPN